jgi:hypothetical protein
MVGVVHGHAEDLPRRLQELLVERVEDPARPVNRRVARRVGEDRKNGIGRGLDGDARADRFTPHGPHLSSRLPHRVCESRGSPLQQKRLCLVLPVCGFKACTSDGRRGCQRPPTGWPNRVVRSINC